jgi:hypothetical protein
MGYQEKSLHVIWTVIRDNLIFEKMGAENGCEMDAQELRKCGGLKFKGLVDFYYLFNT